MRSAVKVIEVALRRGWKDEAAAFELVEDLRAAGWHLVSQVEVRTDDDSSEVRVRVDDEIITHRTLRLPDTHMMAGAGRDSEIAYVGQKVAVAVGKAIGLPGCGP